MNSNRLLILSLIFIIIVVSLFIFINHDRLKSNHINIDSEYNAAVNNKVKSYSIKYDLRSHDENVYILDEKFSITTKINRIDNNMVYYSFKLNKSENYYEDYIKIDKLDYFIITIYKIGNYFAFKSTGNTDITDTHLLIFNEFGNLYKDINEIEKGFYIESINYSESSFSINASRIINECEIVIDNNLYDINKENQFEMSTVIPIKVQYKYNIENGLVDFSNPEKKLLENLDDYKK